MEELADAIEDAQYVNAIATQEEGPRPVLAWDTPTVEELQAWHATKLQQNPNEFLWMVTQPIGLFLFSAYVKKRHDYGRMCFVEESLRVLYHTNSKTSQYCQLYQLGLEFWGLHQTPQKQLISNTNSLDSTTMEKHLSLEHIHTDNNTTTTDVNNIINRQTVLIRESETTNESATNELRYLWNDPPVTEIDECDLCWKQPQQQQDQVQDSNDPTKTDSQTATNNTNNHNHAMLSSVTDEQLEQCMDYPVCSASPIGLKGPLLKQLRQLCDTCLPVYQLKHPKWTLPTTTTSTNDDDDDNINKETNSETFDAPPIPPPPTAPLQRAESARPNNIVVQKLNWNLLQQAAAIVLKSLHQSHWHDFVASSSEYKRTLQFLWYQDRPVIPDDFFVMRVLGRGGFGLVHACKKGTSGKLYAMKVMNKKRIKVKKSETLAVNERQALAAVESKFVINLKYSFHTNTEIYLILDLMTGGDLGYHLQQRGSFSKRECLYYGARILLGLQALHDKQYVYRDLKPENCLLAGDGRVKLTDLGLATKIVPRLHGAAGTRGYWAPEMLRRDPVSGKRLSYNHTVDWFSFGCCLAEFISGTNPFRSDAALQFGLDKGKTSKEKAIDCATLEMEPKLDDRRFEEDAIDICRKLLDKNEQTRLGKNGSREIMDHKYFKSLNWDSIISDRKKPPFIPAKDVNAHSQPEIGTFAEDKSFQDTILTTSDERHYNDWDWTNPRAFSTEVIEFLIYERVTGEPLVPLTQQSTCCCTIL